uniref:GOLD domain-containing protein n=1 Tax=Oryza punctata TaxID=4537 RepID=A0A0E0KD86_ORYPU
MTASPFLLTVILLAATAAGVDALVFDVPSGGSKCLTEELRRGALSRASYRVADATSAAASAVSARVAGPRGEELHLTEGVEAGEFRFEAAKDGRYTACFWTPRYERGAIVSVDVQWITEVRDHAGAGSRPAIAAAKEGHIDSMIGELKKLELSTRLVHEEMISLRLRKGNECKSISYVCMFSAAFCSLFHLSVMCSQTLKLPGVIWRFTEERSPSYTHLRLWHVQCFL